MTVYANLRLKKCHNEMKWPGARFQLSHLLGDDFRDNSQILGPSDATQKISHLTILIRYMFSRIIMTHNL